MEMRFSSAFFDVRSCLDEAVVARVNSMIRPKSRCVEDTRLSWNLVRRCIKGTLKFTIQNVS